MRSHRHLNPERRKRLWRRLIPLAIFLGAFVVFLFFLRYITTERDSTDGSIPASFIDNSSPVNLLAIEAA